MSDVQRVMYLDVELNESPTELEITFDATAGGRLPYYDGRYVVNPRKVPQDLETKNKSMRDDVTVNAINYSETANPYGETVVIGYE